MKLLPNLNSLIQSGIKATNCKSNLNALLILFLRYFLIGSVDLLIAFGGWFLSIYIIEFFILSLLYISSKVFTNSSSNLKLAGFPLLSKASFSDILLFHLWKEV